MENSCTLVWGYFIAYLQLGHMFLSIIIFFLLSEYIDFFWCRKRCFLYFLHLNFSHFPHCFPRAAMFCSVVYTQHFANCWAFSGFLFISWVSGMNENRIAIYWPHLDQPKLAFYIFPEDLSILRLELSHILSTNQNCPYIS